MPDLLPRYYRRQQEIEDERKVAQIILETGGDVPPKLVNGAAGGDWRRMRGLPIVARGVPGTAPNTDPVAALLRKEARGELGR